MTILAEQPFQELVRKLVPQGKLRRIWALSGGLSAEMTAFEIELADGQMKKMIRRCYRDGQFEPDSELIAHEFKLLQIIQFLGLAAPAPYYLDLSGEIFTTTYLVIEYVEGQMMFAPADLDDHMRQLATHLAQIHGADYANFDLSFLPEKVNGCAELGRERPILPNFAVKESRIRQALEAIWPFVSQNESTLLHGDFWPGNSLWQDGQLMAVIDWEDAEWGDPLLDLAQSRSEIVWIFGIEAMKYFTEQYQSLMALDITHLPYWDLCAALRLIRFFGDSLAEAGAFFTPFGRDDLSEEVINERFDYFIDQALVALSY